MGRLAPGEHLGADLTLVERLGEGLSETWLARDRARGPVVAKILGAAGGEVPMALLEREWTLARRLEHPAIVRVLGFVREGDRAWLTLEFVPGGDARRLRGGSAAAVVRAILPVIDALEHAHTKGVVHRDLKASNVLLDAEGRGRLADFGLSAVLPGGPAAPAIVGGGSRGSLSPQQLADEPAQAADDVYGLGALLYDLLSGQPPFWPDFDPERVRNEPPKHLGPPVPERLAVLVSAMLAKRREDRPTLAAVRDRLRDIEPFPFARTRPDVTLHLPPRAGSVIVPAPLPGSAGSPGAPNAVGRFAALPTVALFGVLAVAAVGVFVFLPRWVASRSTTAPIENAAAVPPTTSPAPPPAPSPSSATSEDALISRAPRPERSRPSARPTEPTPPAAEASEGEWSRAMSDGLAALDRREFAEARAAFARAEAARPGTSSVAEGLARAEEGLKSQALSLHQTRGESAEGREDWRGALVEYDAALKLEPQVAFAVSGRARTLPRAELDELLASYVKRPDRLSSEAVAREAAQALDRARDAAPAGPRLQQQISSLDRFLHEARTPVDVQILSDGLTEVAVLRVGALGAFREKTLALRPGSYIVVGKRQGYRDVRKTLRVSPAPGSSPLVVRCDEAL